jgi:hypothetical protein
MDIISIKTHIMKQDLFYTSTERPVKLLFWTLWFECTCFLIILYSE